MPHPVYKKSHETETTCSSEAGEDKKVSMNEIKSFRMINKLMYVLSVITNFFYVYQPFCFLRKSITALGLKINFLYFCLCCPCFPYNKLHNIVVEMFFKNHFQTQVT